MPFFCMSEDGNQPTILLTNLETGDVLAACPECAPGLLGGALVSLTGTDWAPVTGTATVPGPDDDQDEPEHADETGTPQGEPHPAPEPGPEPAPEPELAPVPDSDRDEPGDEPGEYDTADHELHAAIQADAADAADTPGFTPETVARALDDEPQPVQS